MAWSFHRHLAAVVSCTEAATFVRTQEIVPTIDIITFADLRVLSISFNLVVVFPA